MSGGVLPLVVHLGILIIRDLFFEIFVSTMDAILTPLMDCGSLVERDGAQSQVEPESASSSHGSRRSRTRSETLRALGEQRNLLQDCLSKLQQASSEASADNIRYLRDASLPDRGCAIV